MLFLLLRDRCDIKSSYITLANFFTCEYICISLYVHTTQCICLY